MPERRLDTLGNVVASRLPRRAALIGLAGGAVAALLAALSALRAPERASAQSATPPAGATAYLVQRHYQLRPDASMDELVRRVNEGFVPIVEGIPGFREYIFVDAGDGAHMTIGLYDDPSGAEASTREAAGWAAENVATLIEGPPELAEGRVRIHVG